MTETDTSIAYIRRMQTRRSFFGLLGLVRFVLPRLAATAPRAVTLLVTAIAGWRFNEGPGLESRLRSGDTLHLCLELDNRHAPRALAVHHPAPAAPTEVVPLILPWGEE